MIQTLNKSSNTKKQAKPYSKTQGNAKKTPLFHLAVGVVEGKFVKSTDGPRLRLTDGTRLVISEIDQRLAVWLFANLEAIAGKNLRWLVYPQSKNTFCLKACNAPQLQDLEIGEFFVAGGMSKDQQAIYVGRNFKSKQHNFVAIRGLPAMPPNSPIACKCRLVGDQLEFIELIKIAHLKEITGAKPDRNQSS